jgi:hypothetical protein
MVNEILAEEIQDMMNDDVEPLSVWGALDVDKQLLDYEELRRLLVTDEIISSIETKTMTMTMTEIESDFDYDDESTLSDTYDNDDDDSWNGTYDDGFYSRPFKKQHTSFDADEDESDRESMEREDDVSESHVSIRTPSLDEQNAIILQSHSIREVSPEQTHSPMSMRFPELADVQVQVQRALTKLECSMRRSEATRMFVKRQRFHSSVHTKNDESAETTSMTDFSASRNNSAIAETRRRLYHMIHTGVSFSAMDPSF